MNELNISYTHVIPLLALFKLRVLKCLLLCGCTSTVNRIRVYKVVKPLCKASHDKEDHSSSKDCVEDGALTLCSG